MFKEEEDNVQDKKSHLSGFMSCPKQKKRVRSKPLFQDKLSLLRVLKILTNVQITF